jgi:ferritin-like metal-binding protein YciE
MYWAEKALTKAIPKMIEKASSRELINALNEHLDVTEDQIEKLEEVFSLLGEKASGKKCPAMEGLVKEANEIIREMEKGSVRDAGIICAAQKVEHYEIATYGCLSTYAQILDEMEAVDILEEILQEEKDADVTLTQIAQSINWEAAEEGEDYDEDDEDTSDDDYDDEDEDEESSDEDDEDSDIRFEEEEEDSIQMKTSSAKADDSELEAIEK